jgi:hypothetical protein
MSVAAGPRAISLGGVRTAVRRLELLWPVLITALVYVAFIGAQLDSAHGNPAILIHFGRVFTAVTHPPAGDPIVAAKGYDGQLYWLQAQDPLLLHASTIARLAATSPSYSLQRVAYPALAWLLAGGRDGALPWTLLIVNLLAVLGLTAAFSVYARRRGHHPAWALVVGLSPGLLVSSILDLSDVLATTTMLGALMCARRDRWWGAGALLSLSVLSREPMMLAVAAVGLELAWRGVQMLPSWSQVAGLVRRAWPALALPTAAYLGWHHYVSTLAVPHIAGAAASTVDMPIFPPFIGLWSAAEQAARHLTSTSAFVLPYCALIAAGILISVALLLRRGPSAPVAMAALYGVLVISAIGFGDQVELTRYTMPMFLALLLAGLEQRSRSALTVAACASAMTVLLPLFI